MAKSRVPSPQSTISFKPVKAGGRTYKVGDEILIPARITRTGDAGIPTITVQIPGYPSPVTAPIKYLVGEAD